MNSLRVVAVLSFVGHAFFCVMSLLKKLGRL